MLEMRAQPRESSAAVASAAFILESAAIVPAPLREPVPVFSAARQTLVAARLPTPL